jgi:hypothetical protein
VKGVFWGEVYTQQSEPTAAASAPLRPRARLRRGQSRGPLVKTESTHRSQNRNRRRSGNEIFLSFRKWQPLLAYLAGL